MSFRPKGEIFPRTLHPLGMTGLGPSLGVLGVLCARHIRIRGIFSSQKFAQAAGIIMDSSTTIPKIDEFLYSMRSLRINRISTLKRSTSGQLPSWVRRTFFDAQDEIDRRREQRIAEIEGKLQQRVSRTRLFSIRWRLAGSKAGILAWNTSHGFWADCLSEP